MTIAEKIRAGTPPDGKTERVEMVDRPLVCSDCKHVSTPAPAESIIALRTCPKCRGKMLIEHASVAIIEVTYWRGQVDCRNCGGDEYSIEGGPCPACKGTGKDSTDTSGLAEVVAHWHETGCAIDGPRRLERWTDRMWRWFGDQHPHVTAMDAAIAFVRSRT
jgi:Zn finger protein HypA/HybF involved in hydrogenase expression